jgi:hypothetical protein
VAGPWLVSSKGPAWVAFTTKTSMEYSDTTKTLPLECCTRWRGPLPAGRMTSWSAASPAPGTYCQMRSVSWPRSVVMMRPSTSIRLAWARLGRGSAAPGIWWGSTDGAAGNRPVIPPS